jgi:hypothetical protein
VANSVQMLAAGKNSTKAAEPSRPAESVADMSDDIPF